MFLSSAQRAIYMKERYWVVIPEIINFNTPSAGRDLAGKDPTCIPACRMQAGVNSPSTLDSNTA